MIRIAASGPTPALTLRRWTEEDIPALIKAHADPDMRRWLMRHIENEEQALATLLTQQADWNARTRFTFAVVGVVGGADELLGGVSLRRVAKEPDAAEVGYWTVAEARGKSVAVRAVEGVLNWAEGAWGDEPLERFNLIHTLGNNASCRVATKLGFELAEELPPYPPKFMEPGHLHVRHVHER